LNLFFKFFGVLLLGFFLQQSDGCEDNQATKTENKVAEQQAQSLEQAIQQVGMPGITNFTEKKLVRKLYELRDQNGLATYTYVPDINGRMWHLCDSIGYGLPYGVQFTNPERRAPNASYTQYGYNIPQAEPNGLFMPPTAEGTWVICMDPAKKGEIAPVYVEPRVIVSPFKLAAAGEYMPAAAAK